MPRIRTTTASRLTWSASHDSCTGTAFARKAGTNSSGVGVAEADVVAAEGGERVEQVAEAGDGKAVLARMWTRESQRVRLEALPFQAV